MRARYPLPRLWLITDERQGDALWPALKTLPRGSGVIVRHYGLGAPARRELFDRIRRIAKVRRFVLLLAGDQQSAQKWGSDGSYGLELAGWRTKLLQAVPVHDLRQIRRAERQGADLLLLSPLFPTRSHPGAKTLGPIRFARLARTTRTPIIALGGVKPQHRRQLDRIGAYGWAGIDAFIRGSSSSRLRT